MHTGMKGRWVQWSALAAVLLFLPRAALAGESTFERTLPVNGLVSLVISTTSGYIHISQSSENQVHVVGHLRASNSWFTNSSGDVARVVAEPPVNQAGNIIRIGSRMDDAIMRHISIDYDVTTPRNTILNAQSGSGDIQLTNLSGSVNAKTASGDIRAQELGSHSKLVTGSGTVEANGLGGGSILQTGSGDIRASFSAPGIVIAETGSGSVRLKNVQGGLVVETGSGDLEIAGAPTSPWKLETGFGGIIIKVGNGHFTFDAHTGSGTVTSDLPITIRTPIDKHHISGTLNGGGVTIKAQSGSGDIRIE
jgi:DUF4097 and DUF4098 domain-containing protein YvlB